MANLQRNEELLTEIRSLLIQDHADRAELMLRTKRLEESYAAMRAEMKSNYVAFEAWARELAKGNK
jgi:hypothetical protein